MVKLNYSDSESNSWTKPVLIIAVVVLIVVVLWIMRGEEEGVQHPVMCIECGYIGTAEVGDYIVPEDWPEECPKCHKKTLYLYKMCPMCHKRIPLKDPNSNKYGSVKVCPYCKKPSRYDT